MGSTRWAGKLKHSTDTMARPATASSIDSFLAKLSSSFLPVRPDHVRPGEVHPVHLRAHLDAAAQPQLGVGVSHYKLGSKVRKVLSEFSQRLAKHFQEKSFKNNIFSGTDIISI